MIVASIIPLTIPWTVNVRIWNNDSTVIMAVKIIRGFTWKWSRWIGTKKRTFYNFANFFNFRSYGFRSLNAFPRDVCKSYAQCDYKYAPANNHWNQIVYFTVARLVKYKSVNLHAKFCKVPIRQHPNLHLYALCHRNCRCKQV